MMRIFNHFKNYGKRFCTSMLFTLLCFSLFSSISIAGDPQGMVEQERFKENFQKMKEEATTISLTIFPIILAEKPFKNVAEVAALMFEKADVKEIDVSEESFIPAEEDIWEIADSFSDFVSNRSVKTDYALFGEYVGTKETGVQEVRSIIVDREGNPVWVDRQTPKDKLFKKIKPKDPMSCTYLLVERIRTSLGLPDQEREDAPEGKWAAHWKKASASPSEKEFEEMEKRLKAMRAKFDNLKNAKVLVYPVLHHKEWDKEMAINLANILNDREILMAEAVPADITFKIKGSSNEMKMLWDLAKQFQDYLREKKVNADAALISQYFLGKKKAHAVHFVLCDREGSWIIVDLQNDHHEDFQEIDPVTAADCDRLVLRRLKSYLEE